MLQLSVAYDSNRNKIYLFHLYDVYCFDPVTEVVSLVGSNILPELVGDLSISKYVPSQDAIYIFGNRGSSGGNFTLKFFPGSSNVQQLTNLMQPVNNTSPSAAYCPSVDVVYLIGGNHGSSSFDIVQKFNPTTTNFTTLPITLPTIAGGATAVSVPDENAIYVIGGYDNSISLNCSELEMC